VRVHASTGGLFVPTVPEPRLVSSWTVWIEYNQRGKLDVDLVRTFLFGICDVSRADLGFLATDADYANKNRRVEIKRWGTSERFVGDDPEKGLPWLYWMNVFGKLYVDWFRAGLVYRIPATVNEFRADGSVLLQFSDTPEASESQAALAMQKAARDILGDDAFFDSARPDRLLSIPPRLQS
jgi:hypothetical protein